MSDQALDKWAIHSLESALEIIKSGKADIRAIEEDYEDTKRLSITWVEPEDPSFEVGDLVANKVHPEIGGLVTAVGAPENKYAVEYTDCKAHYLAPAKRLGKVTELDHSQYLSLLQKVLDPELCNRGRIYGLGIASLLKYRDVQAARTSEELQRELECLMGNATLLSEAIQVQHEEDYYNPGAWSGEVTERDPFEILSTLQDAAMLKGSWQSLEGIAQYFLNRVSEISRRLLLISVPQLRRHHIERLAKNRPEVFVP